MTTADTPQPARPARPAALPLVFAAAFVGISVSGPLARLSHAEPLAIASWRLAFTLVIVGAFLAATGTWREYRTLGRRDIGVALAAGVFLAIHFWTWIKSITLTSVAASVVLVNMHPIVVIAGSAMAFGERPSRRQLAGIIIALVGAALLSLDGVGEGGATAPHATLGNALALLGAVAVGLYYLAGRSIRQRLSLWPYVGLVYGACFVTLLALALPLDVSLTPQPSREILIFLGIALGPMLLGHTGFNWALRYVPAYVVSLAVLFEPVGATILAAVLPAIREVPGPWTLAGGAVILAGLVLGALEDRR